jgi:hypothetical protein
MLSFSPKTATKDLLTGLPERSRKVLSDRFGLSSQGDERTLDAIGKEYGITRERVRQIENHGLLAIRESDAYEVHVSTWGNLKEAIQTLGEFVSEHMLLQELTKNDIERKHIIFLLTVGHHFEDRRENEDFRARWFIRPELANQVERTLAALYEATQPSKLTPDEEFFQLFARLLKQEGVKVNDPAVLRRYLHISKKLGRNPLGEWGRTESPQVRIKNTRDFAYLTLKRHGSPMHFVEVAKGIEKLFGRKTHPATTHNELIKDGRFVLVGRGLYALKEWGYEPGVVRDVIRLILEKEGALTREEIIDRVKRERYVKDATIAVNLQHGIFTKLADGKYALSK